MRVPRHPIKAVRVRTIRRKKHMPRLTVMVSLYNSGRWIENRIKNLLQSTIIDQMEIWCINADSPDPRDHDIPQNFIGQIHYQKLPNRITVYETWNHIIQNSNGEYITNANTDDIVAPYCYEQLVSALDSGADFAYPTWYTTAKENQSWPPIEVDPEGRPGNYNGNIDHGGVGHFPMWRRSLHSKYGLFDTGFKALADCDWWARCYYLGKAKFNWIDTHLACYLWRDGQNLWHQSITPSEWGRYAEKVQEYQRIATAQPQ